MSLKKGQSSFEFVIFVGIAFLAMSVLILISFDQIKEFQVQRDFVTLKDIALKLQTEIFLASIAEDGYKREFDLPEKLQSRRDYSIAEHNESISVYTKDSVYSIRVSKFSGNIQKSNNQITKSGGVVNIN